MATATKQLEAIYQEISERFSGNPGISISPLDGDPPEKYEITYHLVGVYKDDSGEIQERDNHVISISIPFGFPHFPPSCKPRSPIFHPDFDPAAICIGDFWEKDRTISDLIEHIGQLITGQIFSTSNAFNEEALNWYQSNSDRLPFGSFDSGEASDDLTLDFDDSLEQADGADLTIGLGGEDEPSEVLDDLSYEPSSLEPDSLLDETPPDLESTADDGIDTLDDSFLETDYDFLGSEQPETETEELVPPELAEDEGGDSDTVDTERFQLMARQKRFYELDSELADLASHQDFPGREALASQASDALLKARDFYNEATEFEHQGSPGKALDAFKKAEAAVSDYPGIAEDIERTSQAKELLGDWTESPAEPEETEASESEATESYEETIEEPERETTAARTFFEDAAQKTSKAVPFAIGIAVVIALVTLGGYYYLNTSKYRKAEKQFSNCQTILKQNRFPEAQRQCQSALEVAKGIQFFKGGDRDQLIEQINKTLNSQALVEGLAGKLPLDGKYLPKKVVETITQFRRFKSEGDKNFSEDAWQQAATSYKQALDIAQKNKGVDPEEVFAVTENLKLAEFRVLYRSGNEYIDIEEWVLATNDLNQALERLETLNIENKVEVVDSITAKLSEIALATSKEKGDAAYGTSDWDQALVHYKAALESAKDSSKNDDPAVIGELKQLVIKTELYGTIRKGKEAFEGSKWDEAIKDYGRAIALLDEHGDTIFKDETSSEENRKILARVKLQASIIRDKQDAARFLKDRKYTKAIEKMDSIIAVITASEFRNEEEFDAVVKDARKSIDQANTSLLLEDKISYLEENFIELFTTHYTVSSPESLTEPTVSFEKRVEDKLLFRLQCVEIGRGRPLRLAMRYAHDLNSGEWSFYSSSQ